MYYHKKIGELRDFARKVGVRFVGLSRKALYGKLNAMFKSGRYPRLSRIYTVEENGEEAEYVEVPKGLVIVRRHKKTQRVTIQRTAKISGPHVGHYEYYAWFAPQSHANA
jgi:hypothetical protein